MQIARSYRNWLRTQLRSLFVAALFATAVAVSAAPGDLDPTFGTGGKVIDGVLYTSYSARAVAIQSDGKLVAAGGSDTFALVRYNNDGSLDTSFDGDGKVTTRSMGRATAVAIQPDGKIVVTSDGFRVSGGGLLRHFTLARFSPNGSFDATFGTNGIVTTSLNADYSLNHQANSIAIQSDGKIVAAGASRNNSYMEFGLVRYNADGSLDSTFDSDGIVTTTIGATTSYANSVAIRTDGKIVAAGMSDNRLNTDFALVRYNPNGSLDPTFDTDGIVTTGIGSTSFDLAYSVAIHSDGKIVAAGSSYGGSNQDFALARYNPNGSLDATFDTDGIVTTDIGSASSDIAYSVATQSDGKVLAVGYSSGSSNLNFALARYDTNGSPDVTFGSSGIVTTAVGSYSQASAVAIQTDGKIVAAGRGDNDLALARYNLDGALDTTFDVDGKVTTHFGIFGHNSLSAVATQQDGKIVVSGTVGGWFGIARYNSDGTPDKTFGGGTGKVVTTQFDSWVVEAYASSVAIQPDGKIVVSGTVLDSWYYRGPVLVRYNPDGSLDTSFDADGVVYGSFNGGANHVAVLPDGKILIGGGEVGFKLARYTPNGSPDTGFGTGGIVSTTLSDPFNFHDIAWSVAIQSDGTIVVAGSAGHHVDLAYGLVRYHPDGSLDSDFGKNGILITQLSSGWDIAYAVAIQADGKIVVAGNPAVVRYMADGSLDNSFGSSGIVTHPAPVEALGIIAVQPDGKIVAAGGTGNSISDPEDDFALVRYNPNGSLDTSFGDGDGISTVDFNNSTDGANGMALDSQGRAVVVGYSDGAFALARFLLDPAEEVSISGRVTVNGRGLGNAVVSMIDSHGVRRIATTSTFGYYSFRNIPGNTYNIAVRSKRYQFLPRSIFAGEDLFGIDFISLN